MAVVLIVMLMRISRQNEWATEINHIHTEDESYWLIQKLLKRFRLKHVIVRGMLSLK